VGIFGSDSKTTKNYTTNNDNRQVDYSSRDVETRGGYMEVSEVGGDVHLSMVDGGAFDVASRAIDSVVEMSAEREKGVTDQLESLERSATTFANGGAADSIKWVVVALGLVGAALAFRG
jgi:hypothetical protein